MTDDIPEDVMAAADSICSRSPWGGSELVKNIARAILAEREQCVTDILDLRDRYQRNTIRAALERAAQAIRSRSQ